MEKTGEKNTFIYSKVFLIMYKKSRNEKKKMIGGVYIYASPTIESVLQEEREREQV